MRGSSRGHVAEDVSLYLQTHSFVAVTVFHAKTVTIYKVIDEKSAANVQHFANKVVGHANVLNIGV